MTPTDGLRVGDTRHQVVVDNLSRTQIVQYAGAAGDFNPLHTDERYAHETAGHPSVFAHGMLTMGLTGQVLTDWVGHDNVLSFTARFKSLVWPGDTLSATAEVTSVDDTADPPTATVSVSTTNAHGVQVLSGSACVRLEHRQSGPGSEAPEPRRS